MTSAVRRPTPLTLVSGGRAAGREAAIAQALQPGHATAVILEGLADGNAILADLAEQTSPSPSFPLQLLRIAPGCLCCSGNLVLRVTLNRLLRHPPARLFISLADASHIEQLRTWLTASPYDVLLALEPDLIVSST
ncbi:MULTISPECIES: GTPase [unclassified Janthinobacterium]|uniref:GTPase n=1 Tax=unclassified Janthinobacterium TaxID=2610881 RepID=UPI001E3F3394|nr:MULTISPECIES: GTPase [unclassified Janthinobacterium]MCC7645092.1 GTPase [Janthinobacterium sp. EB271-G4-3-1]MCC7694350.1 GTPase [Janthinobacterium sp. EB271-G4-3-2]